MRVIKIIVGIIAAAVVAFFLIGVFMPQFSYESRVLVNAPVEKSFQVFINPEKASEWITGFKRFEPIRGEPLQEGSKWKLIIEQGGETFEIIEELTEYRQNEKYAFDLTNDVMLAKVDIRFHAHGDQSEIVATTKVHGANPFWRSLLPLFKSTMSSHAQSDYEKLKRVIEAE